MRPLLRTVLVPVRAAVAAIVLCCLAIIAFGVADVAAFDSRASRLEQSWRADEAAGVPQAQLAAARASLQATRDRRLLFLPYSPFSGAAFFDPFGVAEALAARGQAQALADERQLARDDLARLKQVGGPNYDRYQAHQAELAAARKLPDYRRLITAWDAEAKQLGDARDQLAQSSGGLADDGLPKDVEDGVARLQSVISAATQAQLSTSPAADALTHAQAYLKLGYVAEMQQHQDLAAEVKSSADTVQHRIDTRAQADGLLGELPGLLTSAAKYNVDAGYVNAANQARTDTQAAESSGDDAKMDTAVGELQTATDRLSAVVATARAQAQAASQGIETACITGAPAQEIIIHLATQKLVAYSNGCPFLTTLVTTGRPALPTDRGTFQIFAKYSSYKMVSPWPAGSPYWYPTTVVYNAMEFVSDGTFIHSADWEPASAYGPGSEYGPYASHGCVHVQDGPLAQLYAWASIGTTVIVTD
jgi:lipoprotein-anchoring transpeptidase ErfK/SrfK